MGLLTEKYEYKKIKRTSVNGKRLYITPDGDAVASVTTILDATKDKSHLYAWRKKVGEKKAIEITTEAAGVGTRMHKYLELFIDNGEWPNAGSNPYAIQAHKMAEVIKDNAFCNITEIYGSEVALYMPKMYAGTTDIVCKYKDNIAICDFKQTNKPKLKEWIEDYYLQLTAYIEAHNEIYNTDIKQGHIFMCSRDLSYQQFDLFPEDYKSYKNKWYDRVYHYYESR